MDWTKLVELLGHWRTAFAFAIAGAAALLLRSAGFFKSDVEFFVAFFTFYGLAILIALSIESLGKLATAVRRRRQGRYADQQRIVDNLRHLSEIEKASLQYIQQRLSGRARASERYLSIAALVRHGLLVPEGERATREDDRFFAFLRSW